MKRSVIALAERLSFLYLCRAIFHDAAANGISLSFFRNCIAEPEC
ncbi:RAxF-45 family protein [Metabacillus sp. FJAT-52054]|uniref:RAxF-45 family protein n=1 Tax=Metabacillus sediminis TaxID=3117746 RepID=A0ABZ2NJ27_9BACI